MPLLDILLYPDPRLRKQAKPVMRVTEDIQQLIDDMAETMYAAPGIGLAATQVNVHQRILVIDTSEERTTSGYSSTQSSTLAKEKLKQRKDVFLYPVSGLQ